MAMGGLGRHLGCKVKAWGPVGEAYGDMVTWWFQIFGFGEHLGCQVRSWALVGETFDVWELQIGNFWTTK